MLKEIIFEKQTYFNKHFFGKRLYALAISVAAVEAILILWGITERERGEEILFMPPINASQIMG